MLGEDEARNWQRMVGKVHLITIILSRNKIEETTACDMDSIQQKIAHQGILSSKNARQRRRVAGNIDQQTTATPMVCTYQASNQLQAEQT